MKNWPKRSAAVPGNGRKINTVLFPNEHDRKNWPSAGTTKIIGRLGELEVQPPYGRDVITVVASPKQFADVKRLTADAPQGYLTEVTSSTRGAIEMRTKGIQVTRPMSHADMFGENGSASGGPVATDTCFIVSRPR